MTDWLRPNKRRDWPKTGGGVVENDQRPWLSEKPGGLGPFSPFSFSWCKRDGVCLFRQPEGDYCFSG